MTTVQPSGQRTFVVTCVTAFCGSEGLAATARAGGEFRMDFQANQAVVADERADAKQRADVEEVDGLRRGAFGDGGADVAQLFADLDFGPLLVKAGRAGRAMTFVSPIFSRASINMPRVASRKPKCRPPSVTLMLPRPGAAAADEARVAGRAGRRN